MQSGLAKSMEGYYSLIKGALPKADQIVLTNMQDLSALSDSEEEWLLHGEDSALNATHFRRQYITYSNEDKIFVMSALRSCESWKQISIGIQQLISIHSKYSGLTVQKVKYWREAAAGGLKKPGVKVNNEFESEIWSQLLLCIIKEHIDLTLKEPKTTLKAEVVVNVTYSYDIVKATALDTQASEKWIANQDVQQLKFSNT